MKNVPNHQPVYDFLTPWSFTELFSCPYLQDLTNFSWCFVAYQDLGWGTDIKYCSIFTYYKICDTGLWNHAPSKYTLHACSIPPIKTVFTNTAPVATHPRTGYPGESASTQAPWVQHLGDNGDWAPSVHFQSSDSCSSVLPIDPRQSYFPNI